MPRRSRSDYGSCEDRCDIVGAALAPPPIPAVRAPCSIRRLRIGVLFWFERQTETLKFRKLDQKLLLKVNVRSVKKVALAKEELGANIVEIGLDNMSQKLLHACRQKGLKVTINYMENNPDAFRKILR